jgi:hypothetical protein
MKTTSKVLGLVLPTLVAALAQAGPVRAPATPHIAINPQPLPPRHVDSSVRIAINPQPLPPRGFKRGVAQRVVQTVHRRDRKELALNQFPTLSRSSQFHNEEAAAGGVGSRRLSASASRQDRT